jgi:hypothetical protein
MRNFLGLRAPVREFEPAHGAHDEPASAHKRFAVVRGIRQTTAKALFPAESTVPPGWMLALVAVGGGMLSCARQGIPGLSTIWAEDGQILYQGAVTTPLHAYIEPYAGYLDTAPRIVASVVALFPVSWAAAALDVADAIVIGLLAALVYRACGEHIHNPWLRAIPSITIAACPVGQEANGTVINLQWPMYFVAIIVLLWNPRRPAAIAIGTITVVLLTLTNPFGFLLLPIAVIRIFVFARDRGSVIPLGTLAGTAVQSAVMLTSHTRNTSSVVALGAIWGLYEQYIAGPVLSGARTVTGQRPGTEVLIASLTALALVAASGRLRECAIATLAMVYSIGFFAVLMVLSNQDVQIQYISTRYFIGPFLLLAFALIVLLDSVLPGGAAQSARDGATSVRPRPADAARRAAVVVCALLTCCLVWSVTTSWSTTNPSRQRPTWSAALATARAKCDQGARIVRVPITPVNWYVTLTCAEWGVSGPLQCWHVCCVAASTVSGYAILRPAHLLSGTIPDWSLSDPAVVFRVV